MVQGAAFLKSSDGPPMQNWFSASLQGRVEEETWSKAALEPEHRSGFFIDARPPVALTAVIQKGLSPFDDLKDFELHAALETERLFFVGHQADFDSARVGR